MLPIALAAFAKPFILHVIFVFITINIVIDVGISAGIDVYITTAPVGMPPCIAPRSTRGKSHPSAHQHAGRRQEERREGRKSRPPPGSVNHRRVVTRDIDYLRVGRLNDNRLLFHNDLLLFRVL